LLDTPPYQRVQKTQSRSRDGDLSCTSTSINCQRNLSREWGLLFGCHQDRRRLRAPSIRIHKGGYKPRKSGHQGRLFRNTTPNL
jgi:hypothetical protein